MKNNHKTLLHIGGSSFSLPLINLAKLHGMFTIVTDRSFNAICRCVADRFEVIDGTDINSLLSLVDSLNQQYQIVAVHGSGEFALPAMGTINMRCGLKGPDEKTVTLCQDKALAKAIWKRRGIPTSHGVVVRNEDELYSLTRFHTDYPLIIKPALGGGCSGITKVSSIDELVRAFRKAKHLSDEVIVEKYYAGKIIQIYGMFIDTKCFLFDSIERIHDTPSPRWLAAYLKPNEQNRNYKEIVSSAAWALGIQDGPFGATLIDGPQGCVVLEVAPFLGFDLLYLLRLRIYKSPLSIYFSGLMGNNKSIHQIWTSEELNEEKMFAGIQALYAPNIGILKQVSGVEDLQTLGGIVGVDVFAKPGMMVGKNTDNSDICGFIWAQATSYEELLYILNTATSKISYDLKS